LLLTSSSRYRRVNLAARVGRDCRPDSFIRPPDRSKALSGA